MKEKLQNFQFKIGNLIYLFIFFVLFVPLW
jgi:hypothetical protein